MELHSTITALRAHITTLEMLVLVMARKYGDPAELVGPFEQMTAILAAKLKGPAGEAMRKDAERIAQVLRATREGP